MDHSSTSYQSAALPLQYEQHGHTPTLRQLPPSTYASTTPSSQQRGRQGMPPLVLDASATVSYSGRHSHSTTNASFSSPHVSLVSFESAGTPMLAQNEKYSNQTHARSIPRPFRFFSGIAGEGKTRRILDKGGDETTRDVQPCNDDSMDSPKARDIAREAPQAGFLLKLGQNIPEFKRRFFVLQARTHLYYFLSPDDQTPRGCLDLENSSIEPIGELQDGRYRFAVHWGDYNVVLEARSKELGQDWMKAMKTERLSFCQAELSAVMRKNSAYKSRIAELEKQVENFKLVEKDRDGALEDARRWKEEFERLDDSLRLLTRRLKRPVDIDEALALSTTVDRRDESEKQGSLKSDGGSKKDNLESPCDSPPHETSLLDSEEDEDFQTMDVPGIHFNALSNTCDQIRENLKLASVEAATAVQDLNEANKRVETVERRMAKAEKHLCKLWEENCTVRKQLKQKKREKRVLVREVKNLRMEAEQNNSRPWQEPVEDAMSVQGSDEEKLINELEEHVMSSIRLHEQLLGSPSGGPKRRTDNFKNIEAEASSSSLKRIEPLEGSGTASELQTRPLASLFDDASDEESDTVEEDEISHSPSISSLDVEANDSDTAAAHGIDSSPERLNPLLQLDEEDEPEHPQLCAASSQSESSKSVTMNGMATSKLACPLADVVGSSPVTTDRTSFDDNGHNIYHLTFYSRKIGLQFQKVPPPSTQAKGLLTDAMTADLGDVKRGASKTAAELRRIAAITTSIKSELDNDPEEVCQVASPVDAVLVCGFHGFDDSGSNARPKLGARLVAFDGVSVEIGRWTFDSIRKSIQARGRPLTLSFRNDFLTTEQREILTKAVNESNENALSRRLNGTLPLGAAKRRPSMDPSLYSSVPNESEDHRRSVSRTPRQFGAEDDDLSLSASGSDFHSSMPQSFSGTRSVASGNYRSFSEAGSSASVLSAVAPLVSNLLSSRNQPFTPDYLQREPKSVENTHQHQDFKSELL